MTPPRAILFVVLISLPAPGCARYGFSPGAAGDGRPDDVGQTADGPAPGDRDVEQPKDRDVEQPKDRGLPDSVPGCTEQQNVNETAGTCPKQCVSTTGDQDCDGLLDSGQDLQAGTCNRLEFSDGFVTPPAANGSKWAATGSVSWSCGEATLSPGATLSLKQDLPLPDARYLAEIRFTLGPATGVPWAIGLATSAGTAPNYRCELWLDKTYTPNPGIHINRFAAGSSCPSVGHWWPDSFPDAPGTTYILQGGHDGSHAFCRLVTPTGDLLQQLPVSSQLSNWAGCLPPKAGKLEIRTNNRTATLDYVRVFRIP